MAVLEAWDGWYGPEAISGLPALVMSRFPAQQTRGTSFEFTCETNTRTDAAVINFVDARSSICPTVYSLTIAMWP